MNPFPLLGRIVPVRLSSPAVLCPLLAFGLLLSAAGFNAGPGCASCGENDPVDTGFDAACDTLDDGSVSITLDAVTVKEDAPASGEPHSLVTPTGIVALPPEAITGGSITVTKPYIDECGSVTIRARFEPRLICGQSFEIRSKGPYDSAFGPWRAETYPSWYCSCTPPVTSLTVLFEVRILRADKGEATAPSAETSLSPPTIPPDYQDQEPEDDEPASVAPASFTSRIPMGRAAGTGSFNAGSLVLAGSLASGLASPANLAATNPFGALSEVRVSGILRQVKSSERLADIQPVTGGGFTVAIYEKGDFDDEPDSGGIYQPLAGAVPSVTHKHVPEAAGEDHSGGVRVETSARGANPANPTLSTAYLNTASQATRVVANGVETRGTATNFTWSAANNQWTRTDIETVTRDGAAFSMTRRDFIYQVERDGGDEVVSSILFPSAEWRWFSTAADDHLDTTRTPDPDFPGKAATVQNPDGSWEVHTCYAGDEPGAVPGWRGLPKESLRPWGTNPATPATATAANSECTTLTYTVAPENGSYQVASRTITLPHNGSPVTVAKSTRSNGPDPGDWIDLLVAAGLDADWAPPSTDLTGETTSDFVSATESIASSLTRYTATPAHGLTNPPRFPWANRVFATLDAEGNGTVTGYEAGTFADGTFTPVTPANFSSATHVRSFSIDLRGGGLPAQGERSMRVTVEDRVGRVVREELRVHDGNAWSLATVATTGFDDAPATALSAVTRKQDGRIVEEVTETDAPATVRVDEQGIETTTVRDALGRVTSITVAGVQEGNVGEQPDRVTTVTHEGRYSETEVEGGNLVLSTSRTEDLLGRVVSETTETGAVTTTAYPNGGRDTGVTLPGNNARLTTRRTDGRVASVTGSAIIDETWDYSVDGDGNMVTTHRRGETDHFERFTTTVTDPAGRVTAVTTASPASTFQDTTNVTRLTTYEPGTRRAVARSFLPADTVTTLLVQPLAADTSATLEGFDIDSDEALTADGTDRVTLTRTFFEQVAGLWWQVTECKTFDKDDDDTSAITRSVKTRLHGSAGGVASATLEILPGGGTVLTEKSFNRAAKSRVETVSRSGHALPAIAIDINGLPHSRSTHDTGSPTRWTHDSLGRIQTQTNPRGAVTTTTYHSGTRLVHTVTDHFGNTTTYTWHAVNTASAGRLDTITNAASKSTAYSWTTRGELHEIKDTDDNIPDNGTEYPVSYTYSPQGELKTMTTWRGATTGAGDTTTWHYHPASGALLAKEYADETKTTYTWHHSGKPATRTRQRGPVTTWSWNTLGDLTGITHDNDLRNGIPLTPDVSILTRDRLGRPTEISQSGLGSETLAYHDGLDSLKSRTYPATHALLPGKSITYTVPDHHGNPTGYTASDDNEVAYSWQDGRLQNVTGAGLTFTYQYEPDTSLVREVTASDGTTDRFRQTWWHDTAGRLLGSKSEVPGTPSSPISRHGYRLDSLNRRTGTTLLDGSTWEWGYNDRSEVTSAIRNEPGGTPVPALGASYAYDNIGNRKFSKSPVLGDSGDESTAGYTSNEVNQYTAITSNDDRTVVGIAPTSATITVNSQNADRIGRVFHKETTASSQPTWLSAAVSDGTETVTRHQWVPAATTSPVHDLDGNLENDGQWVYAWDANNRLIQMETTTAAVSAGRPYRKVTFAYDWTGHRLQRKVEGPDSEVLSDARWLWDDWNQVAEYTASSTTLTHKADYLWGLDLSGTLQGAGGVGGLLATTAWSGETPTVHHPSFDGNGNIVAWTASGSNIPSCTREYDAFGNVIVEQGAPPCELGFSTKIEDPETRLLYYGYRFYDPVTGRWPSRDPIAEIGELNLYGFVGNDGVDSVDCLGLEQVLRLVIERDSSVSDEKLEHYKKVFPSPKDALESLRDKCCKNFKIGCDVKIAVDATKLEKGSSREAPDDKYPREAVGKTTRTEEGGTTTISIPVLVTSRNIESEENRGVASEGSGVLVQGYSGYGIAHELGHVAGYYHYRWLKERDRGISKLKLRKGPLDPSKIDPEVDLDNQHHTHEIGNVMHPKEGGAEPDECYCRKVFRQLFAK